MSSIIEDLPLGRLPPPKHSPPKVKIEFTDQKGAKYSFAIEGPSKENMGKLLDFVESISDNTNKNTGPSEAQEQQPIADTNFNKVYGLVLNKFRFGSFTSSDVLEAYEQHYQLKSTLSTMSTYLSRLAERGVLSRSRNGAGWIYKLIKQQQLVPDNQQTEPIMTTIIPPMER
jgi:hypothetical protein